MKENDYMKFFKYEMNIRKTLKYPPFYFLTILKIKSKDYKEASNEAKKAKEFLESKLDKTSIILGPATASMFVVNNVYHFELLIKYRFDENLIPTLKELDELILLNSKVQLDIDFLD